jgi:3-phosphoshikimate 1-carboxyvinyltransferase
VTVTGPERLRAFDIPAEWLPRMVDEVPAWAVVASAATGKSRLTGAGELRVKESDRIASVAAGLRAWASTARRDATGSPSPAGPRAGAPAS